MLAIADRADKIWFELCKETSSVTLAHLAAPQKQLTQVVSEIVLRTLAATQVLDLQVANQLMTMVANSKLDLTEQVTS